MCPIYTYAKIGKILKAILEKRPKCTTWTDGQNEGLMEWRADGMTDAQNDGQTHMGQFIGTKRNSDISYAQVLSLTSMT